jgi:hypothetical protein
MHMDKELTPSQVERTEIEQSIHTLRNGMNSLLMNAAVLAGSKTEFPESMRPFLERLSQAGRLCSDELTRLFALIESRTPPK